MLPYFFFVFECLQDQPELHSLQSPVALRIIHTHYQVALCVGRTRHYDSHALPSRTLCATNSVYVTRKVFSPTRIKLAQYAYLPN